MTPDAQLESWLTALAAGDEAAFDRVYRHFEAPVRMITWRICHRPDWVEDVVAEAWARAFKGRAGYDPLRPFPVWMAGIVRNVYREQVRLRSPGLEQSRLPQAEGLDSDPSPETAAAEAELLVGLNECVDALGPAEAEIIKLRFFEELPLRVVAKRLNIAESTLRDVRLPAALKSLRNCLSRKGIRMSAIFPAQERGAEQYGAEEST